MAEEKFRLPVSSYEELCKLIVAYSRDGEPASSDELSRLTGIGKTRIIGNNAFLVATGIIAGEKAKAPTSPGTRLARALEHDQSFGIGASWRNVVRSSHFLSNIVAAIRIRKGMDAESLRAHIVYAAGQPRSAEVMIGANTVIAILCSAELIQEHDGRFVVLESQEAVSSVGEGQSMEPGSSTSILAPSQRGAVGAVGDTRPAPITVSLHIEVRVDAKVSELSDLGANCASCWTR